MHLPAMVTLVRKHEICGMARDAKFCLVAPVGAGFIAVFGIVIYRSKFYGHY